MTRDARPQAWLRPDIPQTAVRALAAFRGEVRPQLLAYGHNLAPFRPTCSGDGQHTTTLHEQAHCVTCGLWVMLECDIASLTCQVAPWSVAALAPCAEHRVNP